MTPPLLHCRILGSSFGLSYFGLFLGLGGVAGALLVGALAGRFGVRLRRAFGLCFWAAAAGLIAARLGGLALGGACHGLPLPLDYAVGLAAAAAATVAYCRARGLSPWLGLDLLACGLAAAHAIAALGCYAGGCCYGRVAPMSSPLAVRFGQNSFAWQELAARGLVPLSSPATPPLYAVQAMQAVGLALLTIVLVLLARRPRGGRILGAYLVGAAAIWFALAPLRADAWTGVATVTGLAAAGIALTLWRNVHSFTSRARDRRAGRL